MLIKILFSWFCFSGLNFFSNITIQQFDNISFLIPKQNTFLGIDFGGDNDSHGGINNQRAES